MLQQIPKRKQTVADLLKRIEILEAEVAVLKLKSHDQINPPIYVPYPPGTPGYDNPLGPRVIC